MICRVGRKDIIEFPIVLIKEDLSHMRCKTANRLEQQIALDPDGCGTVLLACTGDLDDLRKGQ